MKFFEKQDTDSSDKPKKKINKYLLFSIIGLGILFALFMGYVIMGLPSLDELDNPKPVLASKVYASNGELIGQFYIENRIEADVDSLPKHLIYALYATEDRSFESHWGVDLPRFMKAMVKNVFTLSFKEGASTLTQQLAKNLYKLKSKNENKGETIVRKVREWITAIQIERTYTKREILEMYLNISYFGKGAYGIETAANVYFNKRAKDLTLIESATLVALLKSHVIYDPVKRPENSLRRRNQVLYNMMDQNYISEAQYESIKQIPTRVDIQKIKQTAGIAPHFMEYVRQQMEKIADKYGFDLYRDGLNIYTSLDSRMQRIANKACEEHLKTYQDMFDKIWNWDSHKDILTGLIDREIKDNDDYKDAKNDVEKDDIYRKLQNDPKVIESAKIKGKRIQVGFVALEPQTGQIKAMVGGADQNDLYGLNHVTQIRRQPGSSFKPIIYSTALERGLFPAFAIQNQPIEYKGWTPHNSDGSTGGPTMLRDALRMSLNLITARLIIEGHAPLSEIANVAQKMGIETKLQLFPSIALGTSEVVPLELISAYTTFPNKGVYVKPISILRIEDRDNIVIERYYTQKSVALSEETAVMMTDMLRGVVDNGTAASIRQIFHYPAAGKTGTTQDYADAWFIGFTPQLVAGAWVGFDDHRVKFTGWYGQGGKAAAPIWAKFMANVYQELNLPVKYFDVSGNIERVDFCMESIMQGHPMLATSGCPNVVNDLVNASNMPTFCTIHSGGGSAPAASQNKESEP